MATEFMKQFIKLYDEIPDKQLDKTDDTEECIEDSDEQYMINEYCKILGWDSKDFI